MGLLVRKVEGPATVDAGETATYRATEFNIPSPSETQLGNISWLVRCDGADHLSRKKHGPTLSMEMPEALAGKTLLVMAYRNSPTPTVSTVTNVRPGLGQVLREALEALRGDYADILTGELSDMADDVLGERLKSLKFAVDDIIDAVGSVVTPGDGNDEAERRLAIIVGHTEQRPGARAVPPIGRHEYPFNREIAQLMEEVATDRGIAVRTFLRDGVGIRGAYQAAAAFEPEAIIELHFNSFHNAAVRGTETLCSEVHPQSGRLAELAQAAMVGVFGRAGSTNRGIKMPTPSQSGYLNVTAAPDVPSILVEPFFGSNARDCEIAAARMSDYAAGLVESFVEFVEKSEPTDEG